MQLSLKENFLNYKNTAELIYYKYQLLVLVSDSSFGSDRNGDNHEGYGVDAYMIVVMAKTGGGVIDAGDDGKG